MTTKMNSILSDMMGLLTPTLDFNKKSSISTKFGHYAAVVNVGNNLGIAISTDGVGTKLLIAERLDKYDTIGIDCVAMNVNDILCVGATPISMVDYIAVETMSEYQLKEIVKGLVAGAYLARVSIPAGETACIPEMLHTSPLGTGFDLVGTCIGTVPIDKIIDGKNIKANDVLIGYESSGIHSNGLTTARRVLLKKHGLFEYHPEFSTTLGEELLKPTNIYVGLINSLMILPHVIKGLAHITGDGFLNLKRFNNQIGFVIENTPDKFPIFDLIQKEGKLSDKEMYSTFNMGIGFCIVVDPLCVKLALDAGRVNGFNSYVMGTAVTSPDRNIRIINKDVDILL